MSFEKLTTNDIAADKAVAVAVNDTANTEVTPAVGRLDEVPDTVEVIASLRAAELNSPEAMEALGQLYSTHYGFVLAQVGRIVGSKLDPQDIAQDVFLKVAQKIDLYVPQSGKTFENWLSVVASNTARDALRTNKKYVPVEEPREEGWTTSASGYNASVEPEPHLLQKEALEQALFSINPAVSAENSISRTMLWLRLIGYSPSEIAELTHHTERAVHGRVHRARKRTAQVLRDYDELPDIQKEG